jgi:hypothetical protein
MNNHTILIIGFFLLDILLYQVTGVSLIHENDKIHNNQIHKRISKLEDQVKTMLMEITPGRAWISIRPNWLKNPRTGRNMELDLYNDELKIAVEVQGQQHYEYCPKWHPGGLKDFEDLKYRDEMKEYLCASRGVRLIKVPYTLYGKREKMHQFLYEQIRSGK